MTMILWDTHGTEIVKTLAAERRAAGALASGLALTLVVVTEEDHAEEAQRAAAAAAAAHPCRLLVVVRRRVDADDRLDAEVQVGGLLGANEAVMMRMYGRLSLHAESVVLPLLASDAPVVTWWHGSTPDKLAWDALGVLAGRRVFRQFLCDRVEIGARDDARARLLRELARLLTRVLLHVEQDVRGRYLLRHLELLALGEVELARTRLVLRALRIELLARALLDVLETQLRQHAVALEMDAHGILRRLRERRCLGLRGEGFLDEQPGHELGDAALIVREAGTHLGGELQQLGFVLAAIDLHVAALGEHRVLRRVLGGRCACEQGRGEQHTDHQTIGRHPTPDKKQRAPFATGPREEVRRGGRSRRAGTPHYCGVLIDTIALHVAVPQLTEPEPPLPNGFQLRML